MSTQLDKRAEFKKLYQGFIEATDYMARKRLELGKTPEFTRLQDKFITRVVEPMEKAWEELREDHPKDAIKISKVLRMFGGTIVKIE